MNWLSGDADSFISDLSFNILETEPPSKFEDFSRIEDNIGPEHGNTRSGLAALRGGGFCQNIVLRARTRLVFFVLLFQLEELVSQNLELSEFSDFVFFFNS